MAEVMGRMVGRGLVKEGERVAGKWGKVWERETSKSGGGRDRLGTVCSRLVRMNGSGVRFLERKGM